MKEQIVQYLKGELGEEEKKELFDWIKRSEENRKYYERLEKTWYAAGILHSGVSDTWKAWKRFRSHNYHFKTKKRSLHLILKYAAVIVIFLGLGWGGYLLFTNFQKGGSVSYMELSVPRGETAKFTFADQSQVQLNAGSSIRFPEQFGNEQREVYLKGEAYFQVADNKKSPFVVHAKALDIKVLGTAFNVKAYPEEDVLETTLEEGEVKVFRKDEVRQAETGYKLKEGEHLVYNKETAGFQLDKGVNTLLYTSWKAGYYKFDGIQLNRLVKTIERLYDVEILIEFPHLENLTYTGSFYKHEPVDKVLELLEMSSPKVKVNQLSDNQYTLTQKQKSL